MIESILLLNTILLGVCGLSYFYGDSAGNRPIDMLYRFTFQTFPRVLSTSLRFVCGERCSQKIFLCIDDFFTKPNPLIFYLYLILVIGGYTTFVMYGYPELPNPVLPWEYHKQVGFVLFFTTVTLFIKASSDDPGIITKSNYQYYMQEYKPDGVIFPYKDSIVCRTCNTPKPPRSKHCSTCNRCVARFDHHCVWINQCVGAGNVASFLLFLLMNNVLCLYGSFLGCGIIENKIHELGLANAVFRDRISGQVYNASWYYVAVYMIGNYKPITFLTLFCTFIGVFLLWFTWYHWVTLMRCGLTTNEEIKLGRINPKTDKKSTKYNAGSWWKNCIDVFTVQAYKKAIVSKG